MKLTLIPECTEGRTFSADQTTPDVLAYGYRGGNDGQTEYDLTQKLAAMRVLAFRLAETLIEEGYTVSTPDLQLIDVELDKFIKKRLHL